MGILQCAIMWYVCHDVMKLFIPSLPPSPFLPPSLPFPPSLPPLSSLPPSLPFPLSLPLLSQKHVSSTVVVFVRMLQALEPQLCMWIRVCSQICQADIESSLQSAFSQFNNLSDGCCALVHISYVRGPSHLVLATPPWLCPCVRTSAIC